MIDDILIDCRELAYRVCPELESQPLYVLPHPPERPRPHCAGYTIRHITDFALRDLLIAAGAWHGPGIMIVLVPDCLDATDVRTSAFGITLHELAHNLPLPPLRPDVEPTPARRQFDEEMAMKWAMAPTYDADKPWRDHDYRFIRSCLHLHHRATAAGYHIPLDALTFADLAYDLSPAHLYRDALADEPARLMRASFDEIHAATPPHAFMRRWAFDMSFYLHVRCRFRHQAERNAAA